MKQKYFFTSGFALIAVVIAVLSVHHHAKSQASNSVNTNLFQDFTDKINLISNTKQLTFVGPRSGEGYFSKDGKYLIFQSERAEGNPFYQIYLMNLENGQISRVSTGQGKTTCAWIHPSNKKLMFSSTHLDPKFKSKVEQEYAERKNPQKKSYSWSYDENFDIFEADFNGKNLKRLTSERGYDAEGNYSPDGKKIVFASNRAGYSEKLSPEEAKIFEQDASYMMDIYMMDSDGKNVERLTTARGYDGGPFFSADGKFITWRRFKPNGQSAEVYTMDLASRSERQLTKMEAMSWAPFFHPSGDYLIFTSNILGFQNFELFIVDKLGEKKPIRVTNLEGFDGLPVFSPDGKKLSWTRRDAKGESQIYMADWDDKKARELLGLAPKAFEFENLSDAKILESDLKSWVEYLASAEFKGRATGSAEEKVYMQKIADYFKHLGLKPAVGNSFLVPFSFTSNVELGSDNQLILSDAKKALPLNLQKDFLPMSFSSNAEISKASIVFAGYGIRAPATEQLQAYDSYKDLDLKGKWALVLQDIPEDMPMPAKVHLVNYSKLQHKAFVAKTEGAVGMLVISNKKDFNPKLRFEGASAESSIPVILISQEIAGVLMQATDKNLRQWTEANNKGGIATAVIDSLQLAAHVSLNPVITEAVNVVGVLPKAGAKSSLAIGAHGDHLGMGQMGNSLAQGEDKNLIHYGADDNASGVAALIEIAGYSKTLKNLNSNLVFAVWSGEEIGILGSSAFMKRYKGPKFKAYLNMDMVGRLNQQLIVQGVGSAAEWRPFLERQALHSKVAFALQDDPFVPTDGMELYLSGVPTLDFFTGSHLQYHTPKDTADTLNYSGLETVAQVVADTTVAIAQKDFKLNYQKVESSKRKLEGRSFRIFLGTIPDYTQEGIKGVKISGTSKNSPAEKAGLTSGDVIVELASTKVENLYDYVYVLQAMKANQETLVKVLRNGQTVELKITPVLKE